MRVQCVLDFLRTQILATADDQIFLAAGDDDAIAGDHTTQIAGAEITVSIECLRGMGRIGVAQHQLRPAGGDFAFFARIERCTGNRVDDTHLMADDAAVGLRRQGLLVPTRHTQAHRRRFGTAIDTTGDTTLEYLVRAQNYFRRHRRPAAGEEAQAGQTTP